MSADKITEYEARVTELEGDIALLTEIRDMLSPAGGAE